MILRIMATSHRNCNKSEIGKISNNTYRRKFRGNCVQKTKKDDNNDDNNDNCKKRQ